ncbi:MAG TPA: hypothetical protein VMU88_00125 [bacterium]|nr:hypothetical protein [bacterium]
MKPLNDHSRRKFDWSQILRWACWGSLENGALLSGLSPAPGPGVGGNRSHRPHRRRHRALSVMGLALAAAMFQGPGAGAQDLAPNKQWIEQINAGMVFPSSPQVSSAFALGYGSEFVLGYRFNRDFSLSTSFGYYDCDQKGSGAAAGEWLYMPLLETARVNFGEGWFRPYALLGIGAAFNTYSQTVPFGGSTQKLSHSETDLLLAPGLGALFVVFPNAALYLQSRLDMDFTTGKTLNSPVVDGPTLFIPLQAGLSFFVL